MIDSIGSLGKRSNRAVLVSYENPKPTLDGHTIFLDALPLSWVYRPSSEPLLHYDVEILDSGATKGAVFSVFILCSSCLKTDGDFVGLAIESDTLKYYMDKVNKPVILVFIDESKESAFWLFAQDYIQRHLERHASNWRQKKNVNLQIPINQELTVSIEQLKRDVFYGLEFLYLKNFHQYYNKFNARVRQFFNSPAEMELAVKVESSRNYAKQLLTSGDSCSCSTASNHSCSSCGSNLDTSDLTADSDSKIQACLEKAQNMKVLDPKENRIAYYCISESLELYGDRASAGIRYSAQGEMVFYDYLLHFLRAFDAMGTQAMVHLTHAADHRRYFNAMEQLTDIINTALDEGELIAASVLTIRLADTFLFATPYLLKTFGQEMTAPLMDFAQSMLVLAHQMASYVESPGNVLQ